MCRFTDYSTGNNKQILSEGFKNEGRRCIVMPFPVKDYGILSIVL
jgi:hypothetical protein